MLIVVIDIHYRINAALGAQQLVSQLETFVTSREPYERALALFETKKLIEKLGTTDGRDGKQDERSQCILSAPIVEAVVKLLLLKLDEKDTYVLHRVMDVLQTIARSTPLQWVLLPVLRVLTHGKGSSNYQAKLFQVCFYVHCCARG